MKSILLILCTLISINSFAQIEFVENKGQWNSSVFYRTDLPLGALFVEKGGFTYNFVRSQSHSHTEIDANILINQKSVTDVTIEPLTNAHAFKVNFKNSNPNTKITPNLSTDDVNNYFLGNDVSRWATNVKKYKELVYKDLYENIDMKVTSKNNTVIYDFIVQPNADIDNIILEYEGVDNLQLLDGNLLITTSINLITELAPVAYQEIDGQRKEVPCLFVLKNNQVTFSLPQGYDKNYPLIIDPTLIFSTYSGSTADNWGFTATHDSKGNVYSGGIVNAVGYPVTVGAYQTTFKGGAWDIGIVKYNSTGTKRLYATYLGGSSSEMPHSLVVNEFDELLIFGTTGSSNFPVTSGAYQTTFKGGVAVTYDDVINFANGTDIFVSKLSEDGSKMVASTYIGGTGNDGLNYRTGYSGAGNGLLYYNYGDGARGEIITDNQNNIYVGSTTFSTDFPINSASFQPVNAGKQEGIVFKFDYDLKTLIWSSYLGGADDDAVFSLDVDNQYNLFVTGGTISTNFPTSATAAYKSYIGGSVDAFVSHISKDGTQLLHSSYFGSSAYDQSYFVRVDKKNFPYIYGQTQAQGTTLIKNAAYSKSNSGQFLAKFTNDLSQVVWSTTFGSGNGKPNISPTAFAVDICDRIYIAGCGREWAGSGTWTLNSSNGYYYYDFGWTALEGTKNMETKNAYQSTTDGQDFYIAVFTSDASSLEYATFFGELFYGGRYYNPTTNTYTNFGCLSSGRDHVDGGTSRFDKRGNIYQSVCASCGMCQKFPVTAGTVSTTNNSNNCNNAVFRIQLTEDLVKADFETPPIGCTPFVYTFNNLSNGVTYLWNFGDETTSSAVNPVHTYSKSGTYTVTLIAYNAQSCNRSDTITRIIQVLSPENKDLSPIYICSGEKVQIGMLPIENAVYSWNTSYALSNATISNPYASPTTTTNYQLRVSNGICTSTYNQTVNVYPSITDSQRNNKIQVADIQCNKNVSFDLKDKTGILSIEWNFGDSHFSDQISPSHTYLSAGIFTVTVDITYGCNTVHLTKQIQIIDISINLGDDIETCQFSTFQLDAQNFATYLWSDGSKGRYLTVNQPNTYFVVVTDSHGCTASDEIKIVEYPQFSVEYTQKSVYCNNLGEFTLLATGGTPPYLYSIDNQNYTSNNTFTNLDANIYTVSIKDAHCSQSIIITIDEISKIDVLTNSQSENCYGDLQGTVDILASGGSGGFLYSMNQSSYVTTHIFNDLAAGIYTFQVKDKMGCLSDEILVEIQQPQPLVISIQKEDTKCFGEKTNVNAVVSGGTPNYNYLWKQSNQVINASSQIEVLAGIYSVFVTDNHACTASNEVVISEYPQLSVDYTKKSNICYGTSTGEFTLWVTGGISPYSYSIDNQNYTSNATFSNLSANVYTVSIKDAHCYKTISITITEQSKIDVVTNSQSENCYGDQQGSVDILASGGTGDFQYSINQSSYVTTHIFNDLGAGIYTFQVKDKMGCLSDEILVEIFQPDKLTVSVLEDKILCFGEKANTKAVILGGIPEYSYVWKQSNQILGTQSQIELYSGSYQLIINDIHLCTTSINFDKVEPAKLQLIDNQQNNPCKSVCLGTIQLTLSGGTLPYTFSWTPSVKMLETTAINLCKGDYNLVISDANLCKIEKSYTITEESYVPSLELTADKTKVYKGQSVLLKAVGSFESCLWESSSETIPSNNCEIIVNPYQTTLYKLTAKDSKGCSNQDTITIETEDFVCSEPYIFVPNAFTPSENSNNILYVRSEVLKDLYFAVYDRWGEKVFETRDINQGWNGIYKGNLLEPAIFMYYLKVTCINNQTFSKKGNITLIR